MYLLSFMLLYPDGEAIFISRFYALTHGYRIILDSSFSEMIKFSCSFSYGISSILLILFLSWFWIFFSEPRPLYISGWETVCPDLACILSASDMIYFEFLLWCFFINLAWWSFPLYRLVFFVFLATLLTTGLNTTAFFYMFIIWNLV